jgi:hypothetical protein
MLLIVDVMDRKLCSFMRRLNFFLRFFSRVRPVFTYFQMNGCGFKLVSLFKHLSTFTHKDTYNNNCFIPVEFLKEQQQVHCHHATSAESTPTPH